MAKENNIHIAFGFHVNCYHSYRGDTDDSLGFGSDLRIIRKIIHVLNDLNFHGIPVKGTWDCENFFSLEKILPEFAPDIIEGIKVRVEKFGDENIIMGYSNGALGAMNEDELGASIELAVSNEQKSGLRDIFGECEMIVRPQEVMFTPSQVSVYKKYGVKALCLYYSAVPFDAFRTIVPKLSDKEAFNPLTYSYKGDSITVIPTYSNSDVCDAGCLRKWVKDLRDKQLNGEIDDDLFLFINMDADAVFWETMDLPLVGHKIANTDGIHGLVKEVYDLPYVKFDTPGGYLKDHKPIGNIEFTQDTADGNFTGYASWAEKPYNRKIWTAVERSRAMSKVNADKDSMAPSFSDRVKLLSTTHFGLATPVLNIQREEKANELSKAIIKEETEKLPKTENFTIHNINGTALQCFQFEADDAFSYVPSSRSLDDYAVVKMDNNTAFAVLKFKKAKDSYSLNFKKNESKPVSTPFYELETSNMKIKFRPFGGIEEVIVNGKKVGEKEFLNGYINYGGTKYSFKVTGSFAIPVIGNGKCIRTTGVIHLPGEASDGSFTYDFFTTDFTDMIFVVSKVQYPYTPERDIISSENSTLGRFSDMKWIETVPFEITPFAAENTRVVKRNFMGDISSFKVKSFIESDPLNYKLDSFNHQLTGGIVGLVSDKAGIVLANSRQVLNSMAYCPMRLDSDGTVHMNPFGTYYGKQRHHWSRSNGEILDTYALVAPQGKSIAPSYNGVKETSVLSFVGTDGNIPDENNLSEAIAFADGCIVTAGENSVWKPYYGDNVSFESIVKSNEDGEKLRNPILNGIGGNIGKYITKGSKAIIHILKSQNEAK